IGERKSTSSRRSHLSQITRDGSQFRWSPPGWPKMYQAELQLFRSARDQTRALVENLSQGQMDYSPGAGKWSVGELLDHLLLAEKGIRDDIVKLIELRRAGRRALLQHTFADTNVRPWFIPKALLPVFEGPFACLNLFVPRAARDFILRYAVVTAL